MRDNLISSFEGLITQDIDYILFNTNKWLFFIEEKNSLTANINVAQSVIFKLINDFINNSNNNKLWILLIYYISDDEIYINPKIIKNVTKKWEWFFINKSHSDKINKQEFIRFLNSDEAFDITKKTDFFDIVIDWFYDRLNDCTKKVFSNTREERTNYRWTKITDFIWSKSKIDWIFVNYCSWNFIIIKEVPKSNWNYIFNWVEKEIYEWFNKFLYLRWEWVKNPKSKKTYNYLWLFILEFSNTTPDNSEKIWLNNIEINKKDLKDFLNLNTIVSNKISKEYIYNH